MLCVVNRPRRLIVNIVLLLIIGVTVVRADPVKYTEEFVLHVNDGEQAAQALAEKYQLTSERRVSRSLGSAKTEGSVDL